MFLNFIEECIRKEGVSILKQEKSRWSGFRGVMGRTYSLLHFSDYKENEKGFMSYLTGAVKRDCKDATVISLHDIPIIAYKNRSFVLLSSMKDEDFESLSDEDKKSLKESIADLVGNVIITTSKKRIELAKESASNFREFCESSHDSKRKAIEDRIKELEASICDYESLIEDTNSVESNIDEIVKVISDAQETLLELVPFKIFGGYFYANHIYDKNDNSVRSLDINPGNPGSIRDWVSQRKRSYAIHIEDLKNRIARNKSNLKNMKKLEGVDDNYFIQDGISCISFSSPRSDSIDFTLHIDKRTIPYNNKEWIIPDIHMNIKASFTDRGNIRELYYSFSTPEGENNRYHHPHINTGGACLGNMGGPLRGAIKSLDLQTFMYMMNDFVSSYNARDPLTRIDSGVFKYVGQEEEEKKAREEAEAAEAAEASRVIAAAREAYGAGDTDRAVSSIMNSRLLEFANRARERALSEGVRYYYDEGCSCDDCATVGRVREAVALEMIQGPVSDSGAEA